MDFIKDKTKTIDSLNELINCHGNPKELAASIDTLIFDVLNHLMSSNECGSPFYADLFYNAKGVRDFLNELETN